MTAVTNDGGADAEKIKVINITQVVSCAGYSVNDKGVVKLTLKALYSDLVKTIQLTQLLSNDITILSKVQGQKPKTLGMYRLDGIVISGDGESTIKLKSTSDYADIDNLSGLPAMGGSGKVLMVKYSAGVETEG